MNIEEARLYLEHTSKDDFNLEEWEKENRYQAIQVVLEEIERLNNIINELEKYLWEERYNHQGEYIYTGKRKVEEVYTMILDKIKELKGSDKE